MDTTRRCKRHQRVGCSVCLDDVRSSSKDDTTMLNMLFYAAAYEALTDNDMFTSQNTPDTSYGTSDSDSSDTSSYDSGSSDSSSYDSGSSDSGGGGGGFDG